MYRLDGNVNWQQVFPSGEEELVSNRPSSRARILAAAAELARESGPGSLSLDAVAARAGVSKGGLLYNFPSKAALLKGLVEEHLAGFDTALDGATLAAGGDAEGLVAAYLRLSLHECRDVGNAAAWLLTAMAEDPDFMEPIRDYKRRLLDRLLAEAPDRASLLILFLALEGLRSLTLFRLDVLSADEREAALARLAALVTASSSPFSGLIGTKGLRRGWLGPAPWPTRPRARRRKLRRGVDAGSRPHHRR